MKLNEIRDNKGAMKERLRVGRGPGSGKGKTAGRGCKGQKSRTGVSIKGFEGGQMPLFQRLPKRGFSNAVFRKKIAIVNLGQLQRALDAHKIDPKMPVSFDLLKEIGLLKRGYDAVKILSKGELNSSIEIHAHLASKGTIDKIQKAKSTLTLISPRGLSEKSVRGEE